MLTYKQKLNIYTWHYIAVVGAQFCMSITIHGPIKRRKLYEKFENFIHHLT